jgi:UDP-N-acetylmuramoyl-L-alanyl-D-glutamate--2,6-diaminopimelate ligase
MSGIRSLIPQPIFTAYHWVLSITGAIRFNFPTRRMMTIGVTGTSGKSTTIFFLHRIITAAGHKVGSTSTIEFCIGTECTMNKTKMTQLGRWGTQRFLSRMAQAGCDVAIVETTSQGIEQFRHLGIAYDVCMLTNLYPEHIEAHGTFENYKNAKKKLFAYLATLPAKSRFNIPKTAIVNGQIPEAAEFLSFPIERKWSLHAPLSTADRQFVPTNILITATGVSFDLDLVHFSIPLLGDYVVSNAVAAVAAAAAIGITPQHCADVLSRITGVPGRNESVEAGQPFKIIVDFAFEPVAMEKLYAVVALMPHKKIIHVLGGTGGGRDKNRRPILGNMAGEKAALVVVTNEDPYDEDPRVIMQAVADGARAVGKKDSVDLFVVEDRRAAINFALQKAEEDDIVLITGKGCEQAMALANRTLVPWDDRAVVREEWQKISSSHAHGNSA